MDPETVGKTADALKATANAVSVPDEVKVEVLKPGATSLGQVFQSIIDLTLGGFISRGIIKRAKINSLSNQAVNFFNQNPNATYDDAKTMLLVKELEDSKFSIEDDDMRTKFAKLIAASADKNRNKGISPNYSNVLANLTPESANLLVRMSDKEFVPVGFFKIINQDTGHTFKNVAHILEFDHKLLMPERGILDELKGLGLLDFSEDVQVVNQELYQQIDLLEVEQVQSLDYGVTTYEHGSAWLTLFGKAFTDIVK